jgi:O-antigen/teichoic acid export membrane protein
MIGRKSFLIVISRAISALLGFIGLYLITRNFPDSTYGQIAYTMSLVALFASFADLGFATAYIKRVNEGNDPSDCLSSYLVVKLLLMAAMVGAIFISFWTWTVLMGRPLNDTDVQLVALFTLYYVLYNIAQVATTTFDANMKTAKTQISLIVEMLVRVPLIFFFAIPENDVYSLALTYVIGALAVSLVSIFLMINIDKVTLGYFWSSSQVAIYAAGQSIVYMLYVFGAALSTLLFPTFSKLFENGERGSMKEMVQRGERYLSYILTPIVCIFLVFPTLIAAVLLGPKYMGSADVMQILSLNVLILALGGVYSIQIVAMNRAKELVWITGVQLGLMLLLIVLLVPESFFQISMLGLKSVGTAIAVVLSTFIAVIISRMMVWRMTGLGYNRAMTLHLIAAFLSIGVLMLIEGFYHPLRWYDMIITWMVSAGVFYAVLYLVRELKRSDVRYFLDVMNPKEMLSYLKLELWRRP